MMLKENSFLNKQNKVNCCGCGACIQACVVKAITLSLDSEGFTYPVTNNGLCNNCGLCRTVCPYNSIPIEGNIQHFSKFWAAYNKNEQVVKTSSSGGVFWLLVQYIIGLKGVVYGVALKDGFVVEHERAELLSECERFKRSKYLQSNTVDTYRQVKNDLKKERHVLFSGTPCQIAGLYSFLGKEYDTLYTCDVVCHGVPSKTVFEKYLFELDRKYRSEPISMEWRDKRNGWCPNLVSIAFKDGTELVQKSNMNPYQYGFLQNLYLRPSCYECPFARLPRVADISLADFWKYKGNLENNRGLSLMVTSSAKGEMLFEKIKTEMVYEQVTEALARKSIHLWTHPHYNNKRDAFYSEFLEGKSFFTLAKKYLYPQNISLISRIVKTVKWLLPKRK